MQCSIFKIILFCPHYNAKLAFSSKASIFKLYFWWRIFPGTCNIIVDKIQFCIIFTLSCYRFMICCDHCEEWFHGMCVGITMAQGRQMEKNGQEYVCPKCKGELLVQNYRTAITCIMLGLGLLKGLGGVGAITCNLGWQNQWVMIPKFCNCSSSCII